MIVKIEQIGKYFKVTRVEDNIRLINSPTKEIRYIPQNGLYYFYDNEGNKLLGELDGILWDDFRDSNGDAFADENTLIDFLDNNTGFNTPGATGVTEEALNEILTTHIVNLDTKIGDIATALDILNGQIV